MSPYRVAIVLVLVAGFAAAMYFFVFWMPSVIEAWRIADVELTAIEQFAAQTSFWWVKYWYLPLFATLAGILLAVLVPAPGRTGP
jgi:hypothetical protein